MLSPAEGESFKQQILRQRQPLLLRQQQAQQQQQDPLFQLEQQKLQIQAQEVQRKQAKDQMDQEFKDKQLQLEMVKAAGGWAASLSASVRPVVTYWVILLWSFVHLWYSYQGIRTGLDPTEVFKLMMSPDFTALVSGTINYWFLDRTLKQRGL